VKLLWCCLVFVVRLEEFWLCVPAWLLECVVSLVGVIKFSFIPKKRKRVEVGFN
jgi:hypothetical protein